MVARVRLYRLTMSSRHRRNRVDHRANLRCEPFAAEPLGMRAGWRPGRTPGSPSGEPPRRTRPARPSLTSVPVTPSTTVSSAPPSASATTGVPHACASSGTMPKSSTPGSSTAPACRYSLPDVLVGQPAEERRRLARPAAADGPVPGPSPTIRSATPPRGRPRWPDRPACTAPTPTQRGRECPGSRWPA